MTKIETTERDSSPLLKVLYGFLWMVEAILFYRLASSLRAYYGGEPDEFLHQHASIVSRNIIWLLLTSAQLCFISASRDASIEAKRKFGFGFGLIILCLIILALQLKSV